MKAPIIPNTWAKLQTKLTASDDDWIEQVRAVERGTKKVAMIDYEAYEDPEEVDSYYVDNGYTEADRAEFEEYVSHLDQLRSPDGTRFVFLPRYRRNAELAILHFQLGPESPGGWTAALSLLLGYTYLDFMAYIFRQEFDLPQYIPEWRGGTITLDEFEADRARRERSYKEFLKSNLIKRTHNELYYAAVWILENGGDPSEPDFSVVK